ncbi:hypothetical protein Glove_78g26 [Diversispora epigaea]|uniref:Uncharacterized protein n=1 Tax=Diversispora epigaea TaxID=1348612 RepID=A0A397JJQ0_9GLOM|nr:hypothetical protein Glove_78g26 [Diversispora epigaea]
MSKAHLLEETKEGTKLKQIIRDGEIDLFGEITIQEQTIQWIGQCKMTKQLTNTVINEMKGLLSTRLYMSSKLLTQLKLRKIGVESSHIEELHTIKKQIELKQSQKRIKTMFITKMFIEEMENVEFDKNGKI